MTRIRRWTGWLRVLGELDRTPEEMLSARLDQIEKQLRDGNSNGRNKR